MPTEESCKEQKWFKDRVIAMKKLINNTYTEDEDYIAIDPEKVDHDKLKKQIEEHNSSPVIVEYGYKGGK